MATRLDRQQSITKTGRTTSEERVWVLSEKAVIDMIDQPHFPDAFSLEIYRNVHPDLTNCSDAELLQHYADYGRHEGRMTNAVRGRAEFLELIPRTISCLEIGPFDNPCLTGEHVDYLDMLDQSELIDRAHQLGRNPDQVPPIRWVSEDGSLQVVSDVYDVILSCHNIEHQTDLVRHLQQAGEILADDGYYFLIIPDCRYCFDHYLPPSSIADVLCAYEEQRKSHTIRAIIEHRVFTTHNEPVRHWNGDHGVVEPSAEAIVRAYEEFHSVKGMLDVHAWQFTPASFEAIIGLLMTLGSIPFELVRVYPTVRNDAEFFVILRRIS